MVLACLKQFKHIGEAKRPTFLLALKFYERAVLYPALITTRKVSFCLLRPLKVSSINYLYLLLKLPVFFSVNRFATVVLGNGTSIEHLETRPCRTNQANWRNWQSKVDTVCEIQLLISVNKYHFQFMAGANIFTCQLSNEVFKCHL